jgi:plastocyanin
MRGVIKRGLNFFLVTALLLSFSSVVSPAKPTIVVLANDIDFDLAGEFFGFLENRGIETIRAMAGDFDQYKSEKFIVILGGPDAYDGVGESVQEILTESEQSTIREKGNRRMYVKINPWSRLPGQRVTILAGSDRTQTKIAHEENREQVTEDIDKDGEASQVSVNIEGFEFKPASIKIAKGTMVMWANKDNTIHTTSSIEGTWDSKLLKKDDTFSFTFNEPGTFNYQCNIHPSMKGTVIVDGSEEALGSGTY